jgi:Rrf2 family protein
MKLELLSRTDLAVRALRCLRGSGRQTSTEIAEAIGSTTKFVPHVMGPLVAAGWVDSARGPNGGYSLSEAATAASVLEVIEAVEGPTATGRCVLAGTPCPALSRCSLHDAWSSARSALVEELNAIPVLEEGAHGNNSART